MRAVIAVIVAAVLLVGTPAGASRASATSRSTTVTVNADGAAAGHPDATAAWERAIAEATRAHPRDALSHRALAVIVGTTWLAVAVRGRWLALRRRFAREPRTRAR